MQRLPAFTHACAGDLGWSVCLYSNVEALCGTACRMGMSLCGWASARTNAASCWRLLMAWYGPVHTVTRLQGLIRHTALSLPVNVHGRCIIMHAETCAHCSDGLDVVCAPQAVSVCTVHIVQAASGPDTPAHSLSGLILTKDQTSDLLTGHPSAGYASPIEITSCQSPVLRLSRLSCRCFTSQRTSLTCQP